MNFGDRQFENLASASESVAERSKLVPVDSSPQATTGDVGSPEGENSKSRSQESTNREESTEDSNSGKKQQLQSDNVQSQSVQTTKEATQSLEGDVPKEAQNESKQDLVATETNSNIDEDEHTLDSETAGSEVTNGEQQSSSKTQCVEGDNKTRNKTTSSSSNISSNEDEKTPTINVVHQDVPPPDTSTTQLQSGKDAASRVRSSSASYSVQRDKAVMGLKRRRWSLDKVNRPPEDNKFPPVKLM